ncbi:hypothetical protein AB0283_19340 [Micromonospora vinacea]|uniref:hypothetical protein n=1 Tax=Micromonospora vinacea TaxID=709878 RepID=UPI00344B3BD0
MARKTKSTARQALILAFAAGTLTGAAGMLTLRRARQDGDFSRGADAAQLDESIAPPLGGRFDASPQAPVSARAAQHG